MKIQVLVKPKKQKALVLDKGRGVYEVHTHALPIAGKANDECIRLIAKYFKVPASAIRIRLGASSAKKLLEIPDREQRK